MTCWRYGVSEGTGVPSGVATKSQVEAGEVAASVVTSKLPRATTPYGLDISLTKRDIDWGG